MRLTLGPRRYDLTTRALVMGTRGAPDELAAQGADVVELADPADCPVALPVCMAPADGEALERALAAGAGLLRLPEPTAGGLRRCAKAGVAVVVPHGALDDAAAAGLPPARILPETMVVDVTGEECPLAATAVGVIRGARLVRTTDVRGARRVCDVLAAVLEAR